MLERVVHGNALLGVDDEHFGEQLACHTGLQPAVLRAVRGEEHVREELLKGVAGVLGPVLYVVPDGWLESFHEVWGRGSQLLDDLVPLVNVCLY